MIALSHSTAQQDRLSLRSVLQVNTLALTDSHARLVIWASTAGHVLLARTVAVISQRRLPASTVQVTRRGCLALPVTVTLRMDLSAETEPRRPSPSRMALS